MSGADSVRSILTNRLHDRTGNGFNWTIRSVGGGSINECYRVECGDQVFFCKVNSASKFPQLFEKEGRCLEMIRSQRIIKTPLMVDCFESDQKQVLILEWIREGERTSAFWKKFGEQLAQLHAIKAESHGLDEDNYMGSVPQSNTPSSSWNQFFLEQRLNPMVQRCQEQGLLTAKDVAAFNVLFKKLNAIFDPGSPSLLHGDLWSGNFICGADEVPVLIDPAVYYGHPSVDLAMTTLFGGFHSSFYEAYQYHQPFPSNYKEQWDVANLYPLLIHLYLFGPGYHSLIERTLHSFN